MNKPKVNCVLQNDSLELDIVDSALRHQKTLKPPLGGFFT